MKAKLKEAYIRTTYGFIGRKWTVLKLRMVSQYETVTRTAGQIAIGSFEIDRRLSSNH